jgi:hypothetical protein
MLINQNENYPSVLKGFKELIKNSTLELLFCDRDSFINDRVNDLIKTIEDNGKKLGPASIAIFKNDLDSLITEVMGSEF